MGDKFRHVLTELRQYGQSIKIKNLTGPSSNP